MLLDEIRKSIRGEAASDEATLEKFSADYSIFKVKPQAVVFPKDAEDVERLVQLASVKKKAGEDISLTGRSAGTDMTGGPLTESLVLSFTKYFTKAEIVPARGGGSARAVVEPGVYFRDFEKLLAAKGLLYPPFPASKDLCALGGMVMNNSGGEKTLQYGKTEDYVEELKMVLADGKEHVVRPLAGEELAAKLKEKSFEGEAYRKLFDLVEKNFELLQKAKPKVSKNSAGYALWNVWDKRTFNPVKLFVGSQGTLGILTGATLRLVPRPKYSRLLVIFAKSLDPVPDLVEALLAFKPESIESYDDKTLGLAMRFVPDLLRRMGGNLFTLGFQFLPEVGMILRGGFPKMVLLVEFTGDDERELEARIASAEAAVKKFPVTARLTRGEREAEKYWTIRRESFALLHSRVKGKYAAPFVDDVIVDPKYMPQFLPQVNEIMSRYKDKMLYTIAGHPGNGNFHIIPLVDMADPEVRRLIPEVSEEVYRLVFKYGGSITAEHNDGLIRSPYLREMYGPKVAKLFEETKRIFDPLDIFNPGKKTGAKAAYAAAHMRTES